MADIRIEKKKPVWPWLILVIILAVVIFLYFYGSMDTDENEDLENSEIEEVTSSFPGMELQRNEVEII